MHRRTLLRRLGPLATTGAVALAGCNGSPGDDRTDTDRPTAEPTDTAPPTTTQPATSSATRSLADHDVVVHYRLASGFVPYEDQVTFHDDGTYTYELTCQQAAQWTETATGDLPADRHAGLRRAVLDADLAGFDDRYECREACATDVPAHRYRFVVDDTSHAVTFDADADVPARLSLLHDRTQGILDDLDLPDCRQTPTPEDTTQEGRQSGATTSTFTRSGSSQYSA